MILYALFYKKYFFITLFLLSKSYNEIYKLTVNCLVASKTRLVVRTNNITSAFFKSKMQDLLIVLPLPKKSFISKSFLGYPFIWDEIDLFGH